jgi:hypothetical protein
MHFGPSPSSITGARAASDQGGVRRPRRGSCASYRRSAIRLSWRRICATPHPVSAIERCGYALSQAEPARKVILCSRADGPTGLVVLDLCPAAAARLT